MTGKFIRVLTMGVVLAGTVAVIGAGLAEARAGGGRSMGSRGSRSYAPPSRSYSPSAPARPVAPSYQPSPMAPPQSGGFFRNMAGGIAGGLLGGMLGGMLFRGLGMAGPGGGMGGSGIGLFEIVLLAGIGYLIYRFIKKRREEAPATAGYDSYRQASPVSYAPPAYSPAESVPDPAAELDQGLAHVRQMDPSFDAERFSDTAMDIFFKIQGAWMNRDLAPVTALLTEEMKRTLQADVDQLLRDKRVNRLENIAVRNVEIVEAWQESGEDYLMVLITANLLDYTTDDVTGQVVAGSKSDPVKFQEFWTFRRPVGPNPWRLTAIDQK